MKGKRNFFFEAVKTLILAFIIAFVLRTFLFQPFHIPSESMEPTLYKGDYIVTTKYSLGYGRHAATPFELPINSGRIFEKEPNRGDIVVFKPHGHDVHYIKRLIGLPGDEIQVIDGSLHINGEKQKEEKLAQDTLTNEYGNVLRADKIKETLLENGRSYLIFDKQKGSVADNTIPYAVPEGHYFFMGDNRDHSEDSRFAVQNGGIGYIEAGNLVSRAEFVLLSVNDQFRLIKPWTWGNLRGDRFFKGLR